MYHLCGPHDLKLTVILLWRMCRALWWQYSTASSTLKWRTRSNIISSGGTTREILGRAEAEDLLTRRIGHRIQGPIVSGIILTHYVKILNWTNCYCLWMVINCFVGCQWLEDYPLKSKNDFYNFIDSLKTDWCKIIILCCTSCYIFQLYLLSSTSCNVIFIHTPQTLYNW